jgi:MFS family permease
VSFVFGGLHLGSILGLLAAPALIHEFGWESCFIVFGAAGLLWVAGFEALMARLRATDPQFAAQLQMTGAEAHGGSSNGDSGTCTGHVESHGGHGGVLDANMSIPYRAFLRSPPVQALAFTHFCHNWCAVPVAGKRRAPLLTISSYCLLYITDVDQAFCVVRCIASNCGVEIVRAASLNTQVSLHHARLAAHLLHLHAER